MIINPETLLEDLFEQHPETAAFFLKKKMACPGCAFESLVTLEEAARIYGLAVERFVSEIQAVVDHSHGSESQLR